MAPLLSSFQQVRGAKSNPQAQGKKAKGKAKKDKKGPRDFKQKDLKDMEQFALCDAIRYIRAFEVGREPTISKYEIHIRLRTKRDGPVIRNMLRFPHSVQTESRICVVCPSGSRHEKEARAAGAVLVGESDVFDAVKAGKIEFDRLICHPDSLDALNKAGLGRILGPRGLMPSVKTGTVVEDVASRVEMLRGGTVYRERDAVIRLPIGQLAFSPEQLRDNLRATIEQVKKDAAALNDRIVKEIHEVVLSSTNGPGFSLNGEFTSENSPDPASLRGL
ncbi:mitochondrial 54S ribosomal protein uL1m [Aspergillus clavatus NRRL 1]|uniref:Mitochondrial large ribosomal subunit protein L1, putative n=1 Tax=Aspergillus clavatus (strain ATCC 1007 / CBS 513.65 / DSM 816 / NCTC 3887 / NRRL 1 / QM 1276 / 107) TaxID=344612 RepID=A1C4Y1_ASPCL|nr:mitochondrial 54S ribosomal protein MRPL1 [Aspergillus clavatus NRRL 1]EAW14749.1 mitochondrial large ribosomal subunit protein L1, putative [Aspergillus clavatus NRRL 1]